MKLGAEDRDVLYHLAIVIAIGCLVTTIFGCGNRAPANHGNLQKTDRPLYSNNVVGDRIATNLNQHKSDSAWPSGLTSEPQEKGGYGTSVADAEITRSIKTALRKDPRLTLFSFEVATVNGEVTLKGETSSIDLRTATERVAATQSGVSKINNFIRVTWTN